MSDARQLTEDFALKFPAGAAHVLSQGGAADVAMILNALSPNAASRLAAKLSTQLLLALISQRLADPVAWLANASVDDATAILGRLPREHSLATVNALTNQRQRRRLLRYLNFPPHSVGALVRDVTLRFSLSQPISDIVNEIRLSNSSSEQPVGILDDNDRYAGVLDIWRLVATPPTVGLARDCLKRPTPLRPELSVPSALGLKSWNDNIWLPVVDADQRLLGAVFHNKLVEASKVLGSATNPPSKDIVTIATAFIEIIGGSVASMFGPHRS